MYLYLIRHAQSVNNAGAGTPGFKHVEDAPLTHMGHQQAAHLGTKMRTDIEDEERQALLEKIPYAPVYKIDELYASPFKRAIETAKPLADALDLPLKLNMDIYEYGGIFRRDVVADTEHVLTFGGLNRDAMRAIVPNIVIPEAVTDEGWWTMNVMEPETHFIERGMRVANFLKEKAAGDWKGKRIAMVSHADFLNQLLQTLLRDGPLDRPHRDSFIYHYNTSVTYVEIGTYGFPQVRYACRMDHLPPEMVTT
ncbi:MAG: histidine phosphatase family protein [Chloroflexota bacterium]